MGGGLCIQMDTERAVIAKSVAWTLWEAWIVTSAQTAEQRWMVMKMDDLISRQAAILAIEEYADRLQMVNWKENLGVPYKAHALNWAINTLRDLPSAQPEIIRCKDCIVFRRWIDTDITFCDLTESERDALDFCSRAERRTR